jgi:hypothetical protein
MEAALGPTAGPDPYRPVNLLRNGHSTFNVSHGHGFDGRHRLDGWTSVPSKYFTLSAPSDSASAVTLYRARRETPQANEVGQDDAVV